MALWNGSNINSTETAMVFNQLYDRGRAIAMVRKKNGFLYGILGKSEKGGASGNGLKFKNERKITGNNVEVKLLGKLKTIATVAGGSAEMAVATLTNSQDYWGASEFALAHYKDAHGLPESEVHRYEGNELKTANYLDEVFKMLVLSLENTWGTALHATGASVGPSRTVFGSWIHAVSDGVSSGETNYASYGTLSRTDSGNADFRSIVNINTGDLTIPKFQLVLNQVIANGGMPSFAVAHTTPYSKLQQLAQGYSHVVYDEDWSKFGGTYVKIGNVVIILDQRCPSDTVGLIDPEEWVWYRKDINFTRSGIVESPIHVASYVLNWGAWVQPICLCPSHQGKMTGITS